MSETAKKWAYAGIAVLMICIVGFGSASVMNGNSGVKNEESSYACSEGRGLPAGFGGLILGTDENGRITKSVSCSGALERQQRQAAEADRKAKLAAKIQQKKQAGELCISSDEAWQYAGQGKSYCVVFHPDYFYHTGYGRMFINEKQDYRNGFVAPLMNYNMISWEELLSRYRVDKIAVTGELVWYEGHPEIEVYDLAQITIPKIYNCETSEGCVYSRQ